MPVQPFHSGVGGVSTVLSKAGFGAFVDARNGAFSVIFPTNSKLVPIGGRIVNFTQRFIERQRLKTTLHPVGGSYQKKLVWSGLSRKFNSIKFFESPDYV
jgi:hypothetical protein